MKKAPLFLAGVLLCGLLAACGAPAQSSSSLPQSTPETSSQSIQEETDMPQLYRGRVDAVSEDSITVSQVEGYNYGQPTIIFHYAEDATLPGSDSIVLAEGVFVEVEYSGILTRSLPPQGSATRVSVVAPSAEGAVQNGTIQTVQKTESGYTIGLLTFQAEAAAAERGENPTFQDQVILNVPANALEGGLTEEDLVEGAKICAVTTGIAALSLPPQMPVHALLPYTTATE